MHKEPLLKPWKTKVPILINKRIVVFLIMLFIAFAFYWNYPRLLFLMPNNNSVDVIQILAGNRNSFIILSDGSLWGWGDNSHGQLGDGTTINRYEPVHILNDVIYVASGLSHTIAIKADNTLWAWGNNRQGQLGDGTRIDRHVPVLVKNDIAMISLSLLSYVVTIDGSLYVLGHNSDIAQQIIYRRVMENVLDVSAGGNFQLVLKKDNSLWSWGSNHVGQLGDGTQVSRSYINPTFIMNNVIQISAGSSHAMAVDADGRLWGWGGYESFGRMRTFGVVGDGTREARLYPVEIMDNIVTVSIRNNQTFAIRENGSLWSWGAGTTRSLGYRWRSNRPRFVAHNIEKISSGSVHTIATRSDGSIWMWGQNGNGQLGVNSSIERSWAINITSNIINATNRKD